MGRYNILYVQATDAATTQHNHRRNSVISCFLDCFVAYGISHTNHNNNNQNNNNRNNIQLEVALLGAGHRGRDDLDAAQPQAPQCCAVPLAVANVTVTATSPH